MKMKSESKIIGHYLGSAAAAALTLLLINLLIVFFFITTALSNQPPSTGQISAYAQNLVKQGDSYQFNQSVLDDFYKEYHWAMLLDETGKVIWSIDLPDEIPLSYTSSEIAAFTRWYLKDYPVYSWKHSDGGLLVLGQEKDTVGKFSVEIPVQTIENIAYFFLPAALILNFIAAIFLSLLYGFRLIKSVKPITQAITDLTEHKAISLKASGVLSSIARKLNQTSQILADQDKQLKQRDQLRTEWIAGVSHDIRTPLSMVMGYSSQLEEDHTLSDEQREQASIIRRQSEQIKSLVNDLNLASKLQYEMQPFHLTDVSLISLIRSVAADFLNSSLKNTFTIDLTILEHAKNLTIRADEHLLKRAFANLISNSLKHNPEGCCISITIENTALGSTVRIEDDGRGYPDNVLDQLVVNDTNNSDVIALNNHGIGLFIVKKIIEMHQGKVKFENKIKQGCQVTCFLPFNTTDV